MIENGKTRRAKVSMFRKELRTATFDEFQDITEAALKHGGFPKDMGELIGFLKNSIYSVQIYQRQKSVLVGIRGHDEKPDCPWHHKQKIKNIAVGKDAICIEVFPREVHLVDSANIYWLWCCDEISDFIEIFCNLKIKSN